MCNLVVGFLRNYRRGFLSICVMYTFFSTIYSLYSRQSPGFMRSRVYLTLLYLCLGLSQVSSQTFIRNFIHLNFSGKEIMDLCKFKANLSSEKCVTTLTHVTAMYRRTCTKKHIYYTDPIAFLFPDMLFVKNLNPL